MFYASENVWHSRRRLTSAILRVSQQHEREAHHALLFSRLGYTTLPLNFRKNRQLVLRPHLTTLILVITKTEVVIQGRETESHAMIP